jgi:hypothetical protein
MKGLRALAVLPIRFYQRVISPLTPPSCRFEPSCSEYGAQAIARHGVLKRILRGHPFHAGGLDPVPPDGRWKNSSES